jgi:arylsulfatase A-like enzyme
MRAFDPRSWTIWPPARVVGRSLGEAERLVAGWLALGAVLVAARYWVLQLAGDSLPNGATLAIWLPVACYQDICLVVALGWLSVRLLIASDRPMPRLAVRSVCWSAIVLAAWYAAVNAQVFSVLNTPLTYRLFAMSDNFRGIQSSLQAALTIERVGSVILAPVAVLTLAVGLVAVGRRLVTGACSLASRPTARVAFAGYLAVAMLTTRLADLDETWVCNPHATLCLSLWDRDDPFVRGQYNRSDLADFGPHATPTLAGERHGQAKGSNVIMVVMESVGAAALSHYGAAHATTPELTRLAARGVTFDRIYASQPYTSNSIAGIFCSVYPWHGWRSLPRRAPDLNMAGLGNVLQQHGYRTGLLHTGDMQFDNEKRFLQVHGFSEVHDVWTLKEVLGRDRPDGDTPPETPGVHLHLPDTLLLPAALRWIDGDDSKPFFLTLWTIQTHHPYFAEPSRESFEPADPELDRYLNAVRVTDRVIGDLMRELEVRGLADSTLLVVLGDHGEAFGQHGHRGHSKTLYDEELRIPLVMVSPRLSGRTERSAVLGQQIDVAPTILELLGAPAPTAWQGQSLFAADRRNRVYLFTAFHHYLFGVIDGDRKYVYNATTGREHLYDLAADPAERHNLAGQLSESSHRAALHRRLAAWVRFQNPYLTQFLPVTDTPARREGSATPLAN